MADDHGGRHADIDFLSVELALHHLLRLLGNGFQTLDEQRGDARNELHDGAHGDAEEQHFLHVELCQQADKGAHDDAEHQGLAQHAELLLQPLGIDVQLLKAGNLVERLAHNEGKGHETLAEGLRNADALPFGIILLKTVGGKVGHHQRDDIAHDGCEVAPQQALVHHEIGHGTDEGEMPVVPKVDVHRARAFGDEQQEVHTQANGNDERTHGSVVGHGGGGGPPHVEHLELKVVEVGNLRQRAAEIVRKQGRHNAQAHETHAHVESRLQRFSELQAY